MDLFAKALSARCEVAMYRVMEVIGIDEKDDALNIHGCAAYAAAHDLGYLGFKSGDQPAELIKSDPMLLKGWREGKEDARCNEAIDNFYYSG